MKVVKIKNVKKLENVYDRYDLTVSSTNNFYANNILIHNTSSIFANIPVLRKLSVFEKIKKFFGAHVETQEYDNIYSSRTVIKNQYINEGVSAGYYNEDIWGYWNKLFGKYVPKGWTMYGEIIGFTPSGGPIQKAGNAFDYGCKPHESQLMIYRISSEEPNGTHREWEVREVHDWLVNFKDMIRDIDPYLADHLHPIDILYEGTFKDLYPNIDPEEHWHENIIKAMATDQRFLMEQDEPLCVNKVPREGLVIRKVNDPVKEAFKLKCMRFKMKETDAIDKGQISDIEMEVAY